MIDTETKFQIRNDLVCGDTIIAKRGNNEITGVLYTSDASYVNDIDIYDNSQRYEYVHYRMVCLFSKNKLIIIGHFDTGLKVYLSRAVLIEKYREYNYNELIKPNF